MIPIDLKNLAGDHYRLALDPSAADEPRSERAWHVRIPCRYGFVGVHGPDTLLAHCHAPGVIGRLLAIPGVRVHQRGDREVNATFPPECLDAVAELLGARRRRRLSPAARERAMANLAAARFCHTQTHFSPRQAAHDARDDGSHHPAPPTRPEAIWSPI